MPRTSPMLTPVVMTIPLQLLRVSHRRPPRLRRGSARNLAKSVTVE
jgi:glucosamine 6-phosphate synthetase-like amidotransferase/phosphosugar isomerase protein